MKTPLINAKAAEIPPEMMRWLDPAQPLPTTVEFFPLKTKRPAEYLPFLFAALFFGLMGIAAPVAFIVQEVENGFTPLSAYLLFGGVFILAFLAIFLYGLAAGAWRDWQLAAAARKGSLRHGLFLHKEQQLLLWRLPHQLHIVPRHTFSEATLYHPQRGQRRQPHILLPFEIDGVEYEPLDIRAELFAAAPDTLITHINRLAHT